MFDPKHGALTELYGLVWKDDVELVFVVDVLAVLNKVYHSIKVVWGSLILADVVFEHGNHSTEVGKKPTRTQPH